MNQVIIVPPPPAKECMLVEGKKFCREEELSPHQTGVLFLVVGAVLTYGVFILWLMDRAPEWVVVSAFIGPFVAAGLWMLVF